jgi:hypothetical protein
MEDLFFRPVEKALFESWYHPEVRLIYMILPSFPGKVVST